MDIKSMVACNNCMAKFTTKLTLRSSAIVIVPIIFPQPPVRPLPHYGKN